MLEIIVFAVTLVVAQVLGGLILVSLMMSDKYLNYMAKKSFKMAKTLEEMEFNYDED